MANLMASTEQATAEAKGFVSESVVSPLMAELYQHDNYEFCLRELDDLSNPEAYSIMSSVSHGGCGLALMPLFSSVTTATNDITSIKKSMLEVGLPLGVTIWLDMYAVNTKIKETNNQENYVKAWCDGITKAGHSVGYYYGNTPPCSCQPETPVSGSNVLQSVSCVSGGNSPFHSISIGENSGVCKIRWACYPD